jgi:hypothetical protein
MGNSLQSRDLRLPQCRGEYSIPPGSIWTRIRIGAVMLQALQKTLSDGRVILNHENAMGFQRDLDHVIRNWQS